MRAAIIVDLPRSTLPYLRYLWIANLLAYLQESKARAAS